MNNIPPVPPPAPGFMKQGNQAGPPGGFPPMAPPGAIRPQGQGHQGPPPQHHQFVPPGRQQQVNSSKVVDITPRPVMDEAACKKKLTSYAVYTVKKALPVNSKDNPTWARAEVVEERLDQGEIAKQIKRLNESKGKSVAEKKAALAPYQQGQISKVLDELVTKERDTNFSWSLVQIAKEERLVKVKSASSSKKDSSPKRETTTMTVYAMRAPLPHVNCKMLNELIERHRVEMLMQQNRPPPHQQQNMQPQGPPPNMGGGGGGGGGMPFINLGPSGGGGGGDGRGKSPGPRGRSKGPQRRGSKKYHRHSESSGSSDYDSGSDTESTHSSSNGTSISTESRRGQRAGRRYSHSSKGQHRSISRYRSEPREHKKKYYIEDRALSPRRQFEDLPAPRPTRPAFVPEIVRGTPASGFDPVAAAYQAGKLDANAEKFGLTERERQVPPSRTIERPVVIQQPRTVISYGRRQSYAGHPGSPPRIMDNQYSPPIISPRFLEERFIEPARPEYRDFRSEPRREFRPDFNDVPVRDIPREFREIPRDFHIHTDTYRAEPRTFRLEEPREFRPEFHDFDSERGGSPEPPRFRGVDYHVRARDAEEYMERPPLGERRATEPRTPIIRQGPHPFAPLPLRRRYPPSMSTTDSGGW